MRILFVYPSLSSFVKRDLDILKKRHQVTPRCIHHRNPLRAFGDLVHLFRSELLFVWFASIYSLPLVLLARVFRKKVIVVVGGYEGASITEINYGSARKGVRREIVRLILNLANRVLAVSHSSNNEILNNLNIEESKIRLITHGFEVPPDHKAIAKQHIVITIGQISKETWLRKGILEFFQAAEAMPQTAFVHAGSLSIDCATELQRPLPPNVTLKKRVSDEELLDLMYSAKVYLQLSRHEAFGCSVAEAMLCGCIPVVVDAYALREVVGDTGIVINSRDPKVVKDALLVALAMPESEGARARERIMTHFSYDEREKKILELVEEVSGGAILPKQERQ